jgi:hypothetical protein
LVSARDTLTSLGLTPANVTVASTAHLGALSASLSAGDTGVAFIPGEDDGQLVWVTKDGVQSIVPAPIGFSDIYEAVQRGLGLKFKAAAGKLFYNESYDFSEVAPKIVEPIASALAPLLANQSATHLHFAGLVPSQLWLSEGVAKALKLRVWTPAADALASRLGLTLNGVTVSAGASGLLLVAASGNADGPWIQSTLESLSSRPKTAVPFPVKSEQGQVAASPHRPAATVVKPGLKTTAARAPGEVSPVVGVSVGESPIPPTAPAKSNKAPILIAGTVGLVAAVVGLAMHFRSPAQRPEPAAKPTLAPVETAPQTTPAPTTPATQSAPPPAPVAATKPAPVVVPAPPVELPAATNTLDAFASNPRKFGNARYTFEVTEKGFIQALSNSKEEVLIESAAGISLQGSYVGTDGRRKWFNVGGVDDSSYQATVTKSVKEGVVIFDVKVTHPRFELQQSFQCLEGSVKVTARFTPINLRDPRGVIAAVHSVRLSPVALNSSLRMRAEANAFNYSMKSGALRVGFDNSVWGRDGADGRQTIVAGENGVAFHFTESGDANRNSLSYELAMP